MPRRRITVRELKAEIYQTAQSAQEKLDQAGHLMTEGEKAITALVGQCMKLLATTLEVVEDVQDGKARLVLQVAGSDWPVSGRLDFVKDDEPTPPQP